MNEIQIIVPAPPDETKLFDHGLVALTEAISQLPGAKVAHGFLGGEFGYGAKFENEIFWMVPDYQDTECTCGHRAEADAWHEAHQHAEDCYQSVVARRMKEYDETSGFRVLDEEMYGKNPGIGDFLFGGCDAEHAEIEISPGFVARTTIWKPRHDEKSERHQKAREKRDAFEKRFCAKLCKERGLKKEGVGWRWYCTCYHAAALKEWFDAHDHARMCPVVWPNFWHKPSGLEVWWYKWIGRDMKVTMPDGLDLQKVFAECLASLPKKGDDAAKSV